MSVVPRHDMTGLISTRRGVCGAFVIVSLLLIPSLGSARCKTRQLNLYPASGPQPTNLLVHLDGYGADVPIVRTIATRNPRLESSDHVIPLRLVQSYVGEERIALAVLEPKEELRREVNYFFAADGVSAQDLMTYYGGVKIRTALRADAKADRDPPVWTSPPRVLDSTYKRLGCGPASHVRVAIYAKDAGPLYVKVELERASETRRVSYILPLTHGVVKIGHGMCSGAFRLAPGERARAHLTLVDLAGNETPAPGEPVEIVGPGPGPERPPSKTP